MTNKKESISNSPASANQEDHAANSSAERKSALQCWYLTGATASGKSEVSLILAEMLDAEIISLDSMAIYREMDIGTAKPPESNRQAVPHHLIDILNPNELFSVSQYREQALNRIHEIHQRGKVALFVGGTALYLKALIRGLFDGPPANWEFRKQIEQELANVSAEDLFTRLRSVDPVSADKLHINDRRRIIRALEVYQSTGVPISHWQIEFDRATAPEECRVFTIRHPRSILHERIENRVHKMFEEGLVDEVSSLLRKWADLSQTASQAVGYREVIEHLRGERDLESTMEKVLVRTRRFARHQETWFRGLQECQIIDVAADYEPEQLARTIHERGVPIR